VHPYLVLLRAVNLAGHNMVRMEDLRAFCSELGCSNVRTLLQSGNLVLDAPATDAAGLERRLELEAAERLGVRTDFLVRTPDEWRTAIARNPFRRDAENRPGALLVFFLKSAPSDEAVDALRASYQGPETIRTGERHLYIVYPEGIGRSRLTSARIENALGTRGTGRNWNTVQKLAAAVER
jgi:uncharacterized protein (DUF1697 family)